MYVDLMNGVIVIVAYRSKPQSRPDFAQGEISSPIAHRPSCARDGTIIEVSEWKSQEAIDAAHKNPNVSCDVEQILRDVRLHSVENFD